MSGGASAQPQERALAADTLLRLLPDLSVVGRTAVAARLAVMEAPPQQLVARLLNDPDIAVAGPILEDAANIHEDLLLGIVASGNLQRLKLIARRRRVSAKVAEALAVSGDLAVRLTLLRNAGAEIPVAAFTTIAAAAVGGETEILAPLCTRPDLPVHVALEMFWHSPSQLRRYLTSRFLTDTEGLAKILRLGKDLTDQESSDSSLEDVGAAVETALAGRLEDAAERLAAAARIAKETALRILSDTQGEPLMALFKVCGVPRSELAVNIAQLAQGATPLIDPLRKLDEVQATFDQLSFTKARVLLTYWDWATTQTGPYARTAAA
jgi:uncharacterized protein (DUF2336 family)